MVRVEPFSTRPGVSDSHHARPVESEASVSHLFFFPSRPLSTCALTLGTRLLPLNERGKRQGPTAGWGPLESAPSPARRRWAPVSAQFLRHPVEGSKTPGTFRAGPRPVSLGEDEPSLPPTTAPPQEPRPVSFSSAFTGKAVFAVRLSFCTTGCPKASPGPLRG